MTRARRNRENQALFRDVNERVRELQRDGFSASDAETLLVICECGTTGCAERIATTVGEYERFRANPSWFFVLPGHEDPEAETVVARHDAYNVVENRAAAAEIASAETAYRSAD